jgi:hypothetical protein
LQSREAEVGMRGGAFTACVLAAGCATGETRFALGPAEGAAPLAQAVHAQAERDARALVACFDAEAERRDLRGPLDVAVLVGAREGHAALLDARNRTPATILDAGLYACLHEVVDAWRVPDVTGCASFTVHVTPTRAPSPDEQRLANARRFRAEE